VWVGGSTWCSTFKRWVNALLDQVNDQGILIFTTHGTCGQGRINVATLGEEGCWFAPLSEQKDLPTSDYGTMLVRPHYVFDTVGHRTDYALRFFQEAHWWGVQDTYIFQKFDNGQAAGLHPTPHARDIAALQAAIAALQSDLAAQTKQSQLSLNALKSENDSLMAAIARNAQLHADELGKLQNSIEEIRSSTSWRVTAPVRKLVETIRGH
jgi:HAMP domain-containing protein